MSEMKDIIIKCKCTKCNKLFDYNPSDLDEGDINSLLLLRNEDSLLETLCSKCSKETFKFGAWKPQWDK